VDDWTSNLYFFIPHPDGTRVLSRGGRLPHLRLERRVWLMGIESFLPEIRDVLGDVIVLRCLKYEQDKATQCVVAVYELETLGETRGNWLEAGQLEGLSSDVEKLLQDALTEVVPEARAPWARRGWFSEARRWISAQVAGVERVEQVKNCGISCVLRIHAMNRTFYFKVSTRRALFADEPRVTGALATRFPDFVPMPVTVNSRRGWMILADIGPNLRDATLNLHRWTQFMVDYAHVQHELVREPDWVLNAGCLDRRAAHLETQWLELLGGETKPEGFSKVDLEVLRGLRDASLRHLSVVKHSAVPDSLVHGDWHPGNVACQNGAIRIFDWTDACLSHPFFDALPMIDELTAYLDAAALESLLDAYLETWTEFASLEALKAVLPSFHVAVCLHQIVTNWKILEGLESSARHEMAQGVQYWLGRLVALC
jgi:Phosphotransferase enzyme family